MAATLPADSISRACNLILIHLLHEFVDLTSRSRAMIIVMFHLVVVLTNLHSPCSLDNAFHRFKFGRDHKQPA